MFTWAIMKRRTDRTDWQQHERSCWEAAADVIGTFCQVIVQPGNKTLHITTNSQNWFPLPFCEFNLYWLIKNTSSEQNYFYFFAMFEFWFVFFFKISVFQLHIFQSELQNVQNKRFVNDFKIMSPNIRPTDTKKPEISGKSVVKKGDALNLTCSVESFPPSVVTWTKHGGSKNLHNQTKTEVQNGAAKATLVIPNVTAEDTGRYICTAEHLNNTLMENANVTLMCKCFVWNPLSRHEIYTHIIHH